MLNSCVIPDQCSLTVNEQWRNEQGYYRQTIRQALKQRLHRSKCSRLITSVMCKWIWKLQEKVHWQRMCWCCIIFSLAIFRHNKNMILRLKPLNAELERKTAAHTLPMSLQWMQGFFPLLSQIGKRSETEEECKEARGEGRYFKACHLITHKWCTDLHFTAHPSTSHHTFAAVFWAVPWCQQDPLSCKRTC